MKWEEKYEKLQLKANNAATLLVDAVDVLLKTEGQKLELETRVWLRKLINQYRDIEQEIIKLLKAEEVSEDGRTQDKSRVDPEAT